MIRIKTKQLAMIINEPLGIIISKRDFFVAISAYLHYGQLINEANVITLNDDLQNLFQRKHLITIATMAHLLRAHYVLI